MHPTNHYIYDDKNRVVLYDCLILRLTLVIDIN